LNGFIKVFKGDRVVLRSRRSQRIAEIVVGFSEIWGFRERLPEFSLRFGKLSGLYEFNALIIESYCLTAFLVQPVAAPSTC
jgi:hypothetical protein